MDRAKESVRKVLGKSGHHDTTIHETVAPAVQHETIQQQQHERQTAAIDREVHQDHYHTTEQPIAHSEVLPEQHHHRELPVEHKSYEHDNPDVVKRRLAEEKQKYFDTQDRVEGEKTRSVEPTVAGEHKHHHVHETIQPVVNKQTIEPHVVHTTVPVHEVHHNEAQHHSASALPAISMDQFKKQGGVLSGREERRDFFPGEPRSFGSSTHDPSVHTGSHAGTHGAGAGAATLGAGAAGAGLAGKSSSRRSSSSSSSSDEENRKTRGTRGLGGSGVGSQPFTHKGAHDSAGNAPSVNTTKEAGVTNGGYGQGAHGYGTDGAIGGRGNTTTTNTTSSTGKPSLLDKLNPSKDANGDGQPGFMK